jgi:protein-S-isoprenylcysteine O-methyltransferase Ste14
MLSATIIFYFVITIYVTIIIFEALETKAHSASAPKRAAWTILLFFFADATAIIGGLVEFHFVHKICIEITMVGLALIVAKIAVKRVCMRTLGKYYSVHIVVNECHKLIRSGPYKYVRHPAYLAHIMGIVGISLMLNAFWILIIASVLDLIPVMVRVRLEEKELVKKFGEEYLAYRKETWALMPFKSLAAKLTFSTNRKGRSSWPPKVS